MPTGMNIVAAQRQYRWPKANIVFAAGKNIVLQYTSHPNNKAGIGKPPPNACFLILQSRYQNLYVAPTFTLCAFAFSTTSAV